MDHERLIDRLNAGEFDALPDDEGAYKGLWRHHCATLDEFHAALVGGMLADRLSWVFVAAYQSAVRACFVGVPQGVYTSFAASETNEPDRPGTSLSGDGRLLGHKSWIASSRVVDHLIVTIGRDFASPPVAVTIGAGVHLTHREEPGFLADMSQGYAWFDRVPCEPVQNHSGAQFGLAEPFFMMAAGVGFMLREARRLDEPTLGDQASALLPELLQLDRAGFASDREALSCLYRRVAKLGKSCAERASSIAGGAADDWAANGRLLGMYGRGLRGG